MINNLLPLLTLENIYLIVSLKDRKENSIEINDD